MPRSIPCTLHRAGVVLALAPLLAPGLARAQAAPAAPETIAVGDYKLTPLAELRARGQHRRDPEDAGGIQADDPMNRPYGRVDSVWLGDSRARLGLGAERGPVKLQITLQDARVWGVDPDATTSAYEAYLEVKTSAARPSYVRVGRQAVRWGDGRLLGAADWSPRGRSLDAVRARLGAGLVGLEVLGAVLAAPVPTGPAYGAAVGLPTAATELTGFLFDAPIDPWLRLELYGLVRIARTADPSHRSAFAASRASGELYTGAVRLSRDSGSVTYGVEGAYQIGSSARRESPDIAAWAAHGHVAKRFDEVLLTPTLRVGVSYASGHDGSSTYRQFDPILPDPFVAHGAMDAFAWSNTMQGIARVTAVPATDTELGVEYRYARLATSRGEWIGGYLTSIGLPAGPFATDTPNDERELGHEIDARFSWRPWPVLDVDLGYSAFVHGPGATGLLKAYRRGGLAADGTTAPEAMSHYGYASLRAHLP